MDNGIPGQWQAGHAEVQLAALAPNEPMGVSSAVCRECRDFMSALANFRKAVQFIADPEGVWIFHPNGTIEFIK